MSCQINNSSNYDISEFEPHFNEMYGFFDQKIGFQEPPKLFLDSDPSNQSNVLGKTAYYDPSTLEIHVFVDGRHPKDLLRSIAHELIHHRQNLEGRLDVGGYMGDGYYLKNKDMRALEDEAMKDGNRFMREWEDTKKLEERNKMSLKEWKNNELNQLLLKKFGILKEEKEMSPEDKEIAARTEPKDKLNKGDFLPDEARKELNEEDCLEEACGDKKYMKEGEIEEGGARASAENANHDIGKNRMTPDRARGALEEQDIEETLSNRMNTPRDDNKDQGRERTNEAANLQEMLNRMIKAKNVFINGKRVK